MEHCKFNPHTRVSSLYKVSEKQLRKHIWTTAIFSSPLFLKYYAAPASFVSCASWSPPRMLAVFPIDLWLSIRTRPLLSFWNCDPLTDRLPPIALSSSSESALTRSSKRRLDVGYLDIDLVIPCNLAQDRNNHKTKNWCIPLLQMGRVVGKSTSEQMHLFLLVFAHSGMANAEEWPWGASGRWSTARISEGTPPPLL